MSRLRAYLEDIPPPLWILFAVALLLIAAVTACEIQREPPAEEKPPAANLILSPAAFSDLPGWRADEASAALPALRRSCERVLFVKMLLLFVVYGYRLLLLS